jgi:anti-sigma B factor antagonist
MTVSERRAGSVTILDLKGRLVLEEGVAELREYLDRLVAAGETKLLLNMAGISYVDSCGIGILIAKLVRIRRAGGDLRLLNLTPRSRHPMAIAKLLDVFLTFDSETEALESFSDRLTT